jgi:hypothetical protein
MKAILHIHVLHTKSGASLHLRRTVEDAPMLAPGVDIVIAHGGPLARIQRVALCPAGRTLSVHLERRVIHEDGIGSLTLDELVEAGWEIAK